MGWPLLLDGVCAPRGGLSIPGRPASRLFLMPRERERPDSEGTEGVAVEEAGGDGEGVGAVLDAALAGQGT